MTKKTKPADELAQRIANARTPADFDALIAEAEEAVELSKHVMGRATQMLANVVKVIVAWDRGEWTDRQALNQIVKVLRSSPIKH
jgi:methyl coenzyme M reductase subunit C